MYFLPEGLTLVGDFWCCPRSCSCFSSSSCTSSREHLNTTAILRDCLTRLEMDWKYSGTERQHLKVMGLNLFLPQAYTYLYRQRQPNSSILAGAVAGSRGSVAGRKDETGGETNRQTIPITPLRATFYRCVLSPNAPSLCVLSCFRMFIIEKLLIH
jgi:hypothetical protein